MSGEGQPVGSTGRNAARLRLRAGAFRLDAAIRVTDGGLLAIGCLVSSILLSTAVLVGVATSANPHRRRR